MSLGVGSDQPTWPIACIYIASSFHTVMQPDEGHTDRNIVLWLNFICKLRLCMSFHCFNMLLFWSSPTHLSVYVCVHFFNTISPSTRSPNDDSILFLPGLLVKSGLQVWLKADHHPAASNFGATSTCVMESYRSIIFPKRISVIFIIHQLSPR